ncbi:HUN domain-containing protein [Caenorhabditis elegans]|uniref:HUN domain-containing protein n=1 Tax=Caenorhabditis elegans TaxID=6239 RepID=Q9GYS6_CAEEL|nr:HUN domain-containing protein [Caenorhabditis elegans]CCD67617.1 HUN domain-containing protein [Caenorhabditis elegans]|eukprot:NP_491796.1 Uncharacterized protein CELE_T08B2.11 [Caenorhabditis elegans]
MTSVNPPVRRSEDKKRRRDGKTQAGQKRTSSIPSKSSSGGLVTPPPPVIAPPVVVLPVLLQANLIKDPVAMSPNVPVKEGKATRRKEKSIEKKEHEQPKTTHRKKKSSLSASLEGKTSGENEAPKAEQKKSSTESGKKQVDLNSDGSKEPPEEEKNKQKLNKDLAKHFFKHIQESHKSRKKADDRRIEVMPESSQLNVSARSLRKKTQKKPKTVLDLEIFKPNGEPVWVTDKPPSECEKDEDGVIITNPELAAALAEDNLEMDERKYLDYVEDYMSCAMPRGPALPENHQFDPLATVEKLASNSEYVTQDTVTYNTVKNLFDLSEDAIKRFAMKRDGLDERARGIKEITASETPSTTSIVPPKDPDQIQQKTALTSITFNLINNIVLHYDRHHPIASIQKCRKKIEQCTQPSMNNP